MRNKIIQTEEYNLADFFFFILKRKEEWLGITKAKASFYRLLNIRVEWSIHVNLSTSLITSSGKYECQRIVMIAYPIDKLFNYFKHRSIVDFVAV